MKYDYDPMSNHIIAVNDEEIKGHTASQRKSKMVEIMNLVQQPSGTPFIQLKKWRELGKWMLEDLKVQNKIHEGYIETVNRISEKIDANANKRWTAEEDEMLIEFVTDEEITPLEVATILGRTPAAINARVSKLVGINRIDQKVAGHFLGYINGEKTEGSIEGIVSRK